MMESGEDDRELLSEAQDSLGKGSFARVLSRLLVSACMPACVCVSVRVCGLFDC